MDGLRSSPPPRISIVIPAFREADRITETLGNLRRLPGSELLEIIVVDGSPTMDTAAVITDPAVRVMISPQGRALQMNTGAAAARGDLLLFLHADTTLPSGVVAAVLRAANDSRFAVGAFALAIATSRRSLRFIAWLSTWRSRLTRIPFGDQGLVIRKDLFMTLRGFADLPLMEDVELMRRLRRRGVPLTFLPMAVVTSPRRWEREGILFCTGRNWLIRTLYMVGVPANRLTAVYPVNNV